MECPSCGTGDQTGNFCAECGTRLGGGCPSCGAETLAGARFCTACGEPVARRSRKPPIGWLVAGGALLAVVLVLLLPRDAERAGPSVMTDPARQAPAPGGGGEAGRPAPGLLTGDMRVDADRLFNRIMTAAREGDRAEVARFMPMAIRAYEMVEDLDRDGVYHIAVLHLTGGQPERAIEAAQRILDDDPRHLLALGVAAPAASEAGDSARAAELYRRLLEAYETEAVRQLPEYLDHRAILPQYRQDARAYLEVAGSR